MELLLSKILSKKAVLGVIGLGYVGLPLAVEKAKAGFTTIGFDIQIDKVNKVNEGINYIGDVVGDDLITVVKAGKLIATNKFSLIGKADTICICVPTPLDKYQQPDLSYVKNAAESIKQFLHKDMLIVLESTTYPGTTRELILPILEETGLKCGEDFYLAFSPERVDPGNILFKTKNTPKVVGGITINCTTIAASLYESILSAPVVKVSSPEIAEMEKILENTYRNINIGLVNELAILCNKMNINIWEVIDAAKSKPYGFQAFYPGPGLGGHCIPLDPYYLSWKAREFGFHTSMIETSMMINDKMPEYTVSRIGNILNRFSKSINQSKILILGVAYKNDIDDYRESPALKVINNLELFGAKVDYFDPFIPEYKEHEITKKSLIKIDSSIISSYDIIVITSAHSVFEYDLISKFAKFVFDTKNAMKNISSRTNIELL
jgi:UDP-N-acetyl-D-glucosamine dehydrogenase